MTGSGSASRTDPPPIASTHVPPIVAEGGRADIGDAPTRSAAPPFVPPRRRWTTAFQIAFRGLAVGLTGQPSFRVHGPMAVIVVIAAGVFQVAVWEWCVLILTIAAVWTAELLNTAVELLSRAVTTRVDPWVRDALDVGAGAVLAMSLAAVAVGGLIFGPRLVALVM